MLESKNNPICSICLTIFLFIISFSFSYGFKSDIWALGALLYEMCTLRHPFEARNYQELVVKIAKGTYQRIPQEYSAELQKLIDSMLRQV